MLRKLSVCCFIGGALLISPLVKANGVAMIKELIDAQKFDEAYLLANSYLEQQEGDADFDLQYGVAAIDSGNVSEGVFALERVVFLQPDNALARLELARGYFMLQQYDRSKQLFEQILAQQPPVNVKQRIQQYLELIKSETDFPKTRLTGFVELWGGYDGNINSGPDSQTSVVTLTSDALGRGDAFSQLMAGLNYEYRYATDARFDFSLSAEMRHYEQESEQNFSSIEAGVSHTWMSQGQQYKLGIGGQSYQRDGDPYRDMFSLEAGWTNPLSERSVLKTFAGISWLKYNDQQWRDSRLMSLGGSYLRLGDGDWSPIYFAGLFAGQERPETSGILADAEVKRTLYGSNLGVQLTPVADLVITPVLTYQASNYAGRHWIYNVKRQDDYASLNLNIEYQLQDALTLMGEFSHSRSDSNIELYEYDREQALLGLRYQFK